MVDAVELAIDFLLTMLGTIPEGPFMFLFGLAIVLIILRNVFVWIK